MVTVTSARLQEHGWHDWVLWQRARAEAHGGAWDGNDLVGAMLDADQGEFLSFALVAARTNAR